MKEIHINNVTLSINLAKFDRVGKPNNRVEGRFRNGVGVKTFQQNVDSGILENKGDKPFLQALLRNQKSTFQRKEITHPEDADYEILITFATYAEAEEFVRDNQRWSNVLSEVEIWKGQDYGQERIIWLKIMGVPVHLWESQVFDAIAASMGKVVAQSHATFNGEGGDLIRDTVGIIVEKEWNIQEEITLKWRDKTYSVWCKEDDDGWCPEWCKKILPPEKEGLAPEKEPNLHEEHVMSIPGSLELRPVEEFPAHGGSHSTCMETEETTLNDTRIKASKKHAFNFGSGNSKKDLFGQRKYSCPNLEEVAQRIINPLGPNPRKRPRVQTKYNDPFLLDAIISKFGRGAEKPSNMKSKFKTPDLNSAIANSTTMFKENRENEERSNHSSEVVNRPEDQEGLDEEIKATIEIGRILGINLKSKEETVRMAIQGEGENIGSP
ncbi:hypothetical protein L1987_83270 [Smallanthus sonchifolius]|uniref:Uncharacterized protein n=1 Tax=Smallanthus sonchifolius TaxID=185202 RepID=A0ACB8YBX6_9ASTR|nr:hypothetical protein L1987_83270 [Smallanthus sonchifolius]